MDKQVVAIVGGQWGDEGKGKLVDLLAKDADLVCRYNGGANAGNYFLCYIYDHFCMWGALEDDSRFREAFL